MTPWLLASGDFVPVGGMDTANHALASFLARRGGTDVHLVAHRVAPELASRPGVHVHRVPRPFGLHTLGEPLLTRVATRRSRDVLRSGGHVMANGGNLNAGDVAWIHYVHAAYAPVSAGTLNAALGAFKHRQYLAAERRALTQARLIICNSDRTVRDVVNLVDVDPARVRRIYYGIDAARFHDQSDSAAAKVRLGYRPDTPIVLFVGALGDRRKGFDTLFDAWQAVCRRSGWDARLLVAGSGAELASWRARAETNGTASRMTFLGYRTDVGDLMAAADLLVHPARYEAYGLAVHEALCCGVPAIVSSCAGVVERLPESLAGLLIHDANSADDLAARLLYWRDRALDLREHTRNVGAILRTRSWDDMSREIADMTES
jgi:glycosyltransferase involved in cell wall biosynthesis